MTAAACRKRVHTANKRASGRCIPACTQRSERPPDCSDDNPTKGTDKSDLRSLRVLINPTKGTDNPTKGTDNPTKATKIVSWRAYRGTAACTACRSTGLCTHTSAAKRAAPGGGPRGQPVLWPSGNFRSRAECLNLGRVGGAPRSLGGRVVTHVCLIVDRGKPAVLALHVLAWPVQKIWNACARAIGLLGRLHGRATRRATNAAATAWRRPTL
jgi:hypothetical protein